MKKFIKKLKRLFCRHNYIPWAYIDKATSEKYFDGAKTVYICTKCGKRKYSKEEVDAPLNYSDFIDVLYLFSCGAVSIDEAVNILQLNSVDKDLYKFLFGGNING